MTPVVAVLATVDTKAQEAAFLRAELRERGCRVRVVDVGLRVGPDHPAWVDVPGTVVANATGAVLDELRERERRDHAMAAMGAGAATILAAWRARGELDGVLAVGGNQGTAIAASAMRELPFGLPKYIVSTVASGDVRGFVGDSDIVLAFSVGDLLGGPNRVTRTVLRQAAAGVAAMARDAADVPDPEDGPLVAVTAFGNTHRAVTTAIDHLSRAGVHAVPFHASGASGSAMERFVADGMFAGVLDLTTHELLAELYPADIYAPVRPGRLTAAGRTGVPQVVAPGGLEYHCFAAADTIPPELRDRPTHHHNPNNTNVRSSGAELRRAAGAMAERLNRASGPAAVLIPTQGWSQVGSPGGPLHDPAANAEFVAELRGALADHVRLQEIPATINDPLFATRAADTLLEFLNITVPATQPAAHS
jgi:uncharacterized protein (UPF0261 family)